MSNHIINTDLFQAVFQLIDRDNEEQYLLSRLKNKAMAIESGPNTFVITFNSGQEVLITNELDIYFIDTIIPNVYCNNDNKYTKLSADRVYFYLNRILDLLMYGR